jgi:hypothetical protein
MTTPDKRSRYAKVQTRAVADVHGREQVLIELRTIPELPARLEIRPDIGQRLDHLAHRYYRDPTMFWTICDANDHLDPFDVVAPDELVRIPPER